MKALILAAGKGKRMKELTSEIPKPMLLVHGKPILQHIIEGLRDALNLREIFIVIGYQGEIIRNHFGTGSDYGVTITYGEQLVQDGTGKAPELAKEWVGKDNFLLTYGDILINPSDYRYLSDHLEGDGALALRQGEDLSQGGAVVLNSKGWMERLIEKTTSPPPHAYYNAGIYLLTPTIFQWTARLEKSPRGEYELTDALTALVKAGGRLKGVILRHHWVDVRDPQVLEQLNTSPS